MALTVCRVPGCPTLTRSGLCPTHTRQVDRKRGSRQQRGYDAAHDRKRRTLVANADAGTVAYARCGELIKQGEPWDLGHDDSRAGYRGAEHVRCNRATMGRERPT